MNKFENQFEKISQFKVRFIDDADEYEELHSKEGGGNLSGEALRVLKPAFNSKEGLYMYRPTFESVEGYDSEYMDWVVEHERVEYDLDMKTRTGSADDLAELEEAGLPDKREDEEAFFRAIHERALSGEIDTAIENGKDEAYEKYLEAYLALVQGKIDNGEIEVSDEDFSRFKERQDERLRLLRERRKA